VKLFSTRFFESGSQSNFPFNFQPDFQVRKGYCLALLAYAFIGVMLTGVSNALARPIDKPVGSYQLQCDETFSCPASLLPRVSFWVEVFSRWDTNTAIFHDKENPHRVYSVVTRKQGCRRSKKGDSIDRERKRLKRSLQSIASKVRAKKPLTESEAKIEALFLGSTVSEIENAANRVRCQSGNRDRMTEALSKFQLYRPTILDALEQQNLTPELQYLPFVESAFNPEALSHVGAAGLWQIMPSTGRRLGLTVNSVVDERYDPRSATYAAARYFRNSVDKLSETAFENGNSVTAKDLNPFIITSYNYGVAGMQRAIKQVGLNYERLLVEYKSPNFQTAVKNFYASFLAARHVAKNTQTFFANMPIAMPQAIHSYNTVTLSRATSIKRISKQLNVQHDLLKELNPSLKRVVWKGGALVPKNFQLKLPYKDGGWSKGVVAMNSLPAEYEKPGHVWHRVRSGQTACGIADRYRASCKALFRINNLNNRGTIYAGQKIKVPTSTGGIGVASVGNTSSSTANRNVAASSGSTQSYRVRAGDTACSIAHRSKMKCAEFLAVNGLNRRSVLRIGQVVVVSASGSWHRVARGQTPCGIAERYRVSCSALLDANRLRQSSTIYVGQRLRIPSRS